MKKLNLVPQLFNATDKLNQFLNAHDYESVNKSLLLEEVSEVLRDFGYTITVTEVSTGERADGSKKGREWHKIGKYRWQIAHWDEFGTMLHLLYSDIHNMPNKEFDTYIEALNSAILYVIEKYKDLEM